MRVVFYTSGTTGSGRFVRGIAIGNAIKRKNLDWEYTILSFSPFAHLADLFGQRHIEIPPEDEHHLSKENYANSALFHTLHSLNPDVLIVDLLWFSLYNFINELKCKKIFISHWVRNDFFQVNIPGNPIFFRPYDFDALFAVEPFRSDLPFEQINPIIIRNRDEILTRNDALERLKLSGADKNCLYAFNGNPGDFEAHRKKYSYLEHEGYTLTFSTNYAGGLFPAVDYYNAFDFIICAASYNQFWEVIYFKKWAAFEKVSSHFTSSERRIKKFLKYHFEVNGADEIIEFISGLIK